MYCGLPRGLVGGPPRFTCTQIQELRSKFKFNAAKDQTDKNLAGMLTKCLAAKVYRKLFEEIGLIATQIAHK